MNIGPCQTCKRGVTWTKSAARGRPMPLDQDDERGNVVLDGFGNAHVFKDHDAAIAAMGTTTDDGTEFPHGVTYISHHAEGQCPQGREWRGRRRADHPPPEPEPAQGSLL